MTQVPGAWIETLHCPTAYTIRQIDLACRIAHVMHRGKFVLVEPPRR